MIDFISLILIAMVIYFALKFLNKKTDPTAQNQSYKQADFFNDQEQLVSSGGYKKRCLLNNTEVKAKWALIAALKNQPYYIYAQVSLGGILAHDDKKSYSAIASKRVDFLISNKENMPVAVVEIHGSGHYIDENSVQKDRIKRIAVEDAGIDYIAVDLGNDADEVKISTLVTDKINDWIKIQSSNPCDS